MGSIGRSVPWWCASAVVALACAGSSTGRHGGEAGSAVSAVGGAGRGSAGTSANGGRAGSEMLETRAGTAGKSGLLAGRGGTAPDAGQSGDADRGGTSGDGGKGGTLAGGEAGDAGAAGGTATCDENAIIHGNVVASGTLENLLCAIEVRGTLTIRLDGTSPSVLPLLRRVRSRLSITANGDLSDQPSQFELPALERVGALRLHDMGGVERLRMPALTNVEGQLLVAGNAALTELDADTWPSLQEIDADLTLGRHEGLDRWEDNPLLTRVELPALVLAHTITLGGNPSLATVDVPILEQVDTLDVHQCFSIYDDDLDYSGEWLCADLGQLTTFNVPALKQAGSVHLAPLTQLDELTLPALSSVESVRATNPKHPAEFVVRLPSLEEALELSSNEHIDWDVPVLADVRRMELSGGRALPLSFPALTRLDELVLDEWPGAFDCGSVFPQLPGDAYPTLDAYLGELHCPEATALPSLSLHASGAATVDLSGLTRVGSLLLGGAFTNIELPELVTADSIELNDCWNLAELSVPRLGPSLSSLTIRRTGLATLPDMPLLTMLGELTVSMNGALSQCDLEDWASSLSVQCWCIENLPCP